MTSTTPLPASTHKATVPRFVVAETFSLFGNSAISIVLPWLIGHVGQRRMSIVADVGSALSVAGLAIVDWPTHLATGLRSNMAAWRNAHDAPP